jgi:hypothetical protein
MGWCAGRVPEGQIQLRFQPAPGEPVHGVANAGTVSRVPTESAVRGFLIKIPG